MAVRNESQASRAWLIALALVALFAAALFLRTYWNLDAATEGGDFILAGGSDPYYHKRAVDAIQERGYRTLVDDPLLNYPYGAVNPNPPLFQWSVASAGLFLQGMFDGDLATSTWYAMLWTAPVYGALTIFPIYFLGAALFESRRVGLVAALLWTVSTSAIDATGVGAADHDATIMFFATLAFLFYVQTVRHFRGDGNWVTNWRDGGSVGRGLSALFRERRLGFGYALLTAVSISAVALTWKGFPYVIGIIFLYAGFQLIVDHWRNRDSTGLFLATFIALLAGTLLAYPYYSLTGTTNFVRPVWFIIAAFFVGGLVLVPTRDLPTVLVMPAALVVAILGAVVAFFVTPDVATSLLYATVYFKQSALYETIAEAQPASFSDLAFGIGPVVFLVAIFGWFVVAWAALRERPTRPFLFALVWGAVAFYMASSAVRFLFNAIPVFAIFAAFGIVWVLDRLDFGSIRRSWQGSPGWSGLRKGVRPLHIVAVVLIVLLLVLPNALLAADAALPRASEEKLRGDAESGFMKTLVDKRLGAYGQGFIDDYWRDGLTFLDRYDADITDPAARPAFLSWWDYGHWAIAIGNHPAVADNFQNGYEYAANFILSQNETHAIQLLSARLVPLMDRAAAEKLLADEGIADPTAAYDKLVAWQFVDEMDLSESAAFLDGVEKATGKKIRYFATDIRMMPYDDPSTGSVEQSSIFYAPVRLKGDQGDDYVPYLISIGTDRFVTQSQFENEVRSNPTRQISATAERLDFTEKFYNSMFYRAYVGTPVEGPFPTQGDKVTQALNTQQPGFGLTHFRVIYATPELKIIEYTPGARVSGVVTEEGTPLEGVSVTAFDDAGLILLPNLFPQAIGRFNATDFDVPHATVETGADGTYSIVAPFSAGGNVTLVARRGGVELARETLVIPRAEAAERKEYALDLLVEKGSVSGLVFDDKDADGGYNASNDVALANTTITIGGVSATTDSEGRYAIASVSAGQQDVTVDSTTYDVSPRSAEVQIKPGEASTHDVALDLKPGTVNGLVYADVNENDVFDQGEGAGFTNVQFTPDATVSPNTAVASSVLTDSSGNYTAEVKTGAYVVTVAYTAPDGTEFEGEATVVVVSGETATADLRLTKKA